MFSKKVWRALMTSVTLTLCLVPMAAQAAVRSNPKGEAKPAAVRVQERGLAATLWRTLTSLFEKNGASIDPSGSTNPGAGAGTNGAGTGENGGSIDPSGRT